MERKFKRESQEDREQPRESALRRYSRVVQTQTAYPRDQYEHGAYVLDPDDKMEIRREGLEKFSAIVDKNILLCNISNDTLMRYYQTDAILLTHMLDMAIREEAIEPLFRVLFHGWKSELLLTRTKGGAERKHQAQVGAPSYSPNEKLLGYGSDMNLEQETDKSFLDNLFGKKKRKEQR